MYEVDTKSIRGFGTETFFVDSERGIYTPSDWTMEFGKSLTTVSRQGKKPLVYLGEINLVKMSFKLHLDCRFVDVNEKITIWKGFAESDTAIYRPYFDAEVITNKKFVVTSVKVSNVVSIGGVKRSADLDISIEEYIPPNNTAENKLLVRLDHYV